MSSWNRVIRRSFSTSQHVGDNLRTLLREKGPTSRTLLQRFYKERFNQDFQKKRTLKKHLQKFPELEVYTVGSNASVRSVRITGRDQAQLKSSDKPDIIDSAHKLDRFRSNSWYKGESVVAVDCEGVPSNLYLIQVATKRQTYIFDTVKLAPKEVCSILQPLLEDPNVVKLMHDLRCDAIALRNFGGIENPKALLDTQLVMEQLTGKFNHGMNSMLTYFLQQEHPEKKQMALILKKTGDASIFKVRPLSPLVVSYCANDVDLLLKAHAVMPKEVDESSMPKLIDSSIKRYKGTKEKSDRDR